MGKVDFGGFIHRKWCLWSLWWEPVILRFAVAVGVDDDASEAVMEMTEGVRSIVAFPSLRGKGVKSNLIFQKAA